jgi:hypothetical protein
LQSRLEGYSCDDSVRRKEQEIKESKNGKINGKEKKERKVE